METEVKLNPKTIFPPQKTKITSFIPEASYKFTKQDLNWKDVSKINNEKFLEQRNNYFENYKKNIERKIARKKHSKTELLEDLNSQRPSIASIKEKYISEGMSFEEAELLVNYINYPYLKETKLTKRQFNKIKKIIEVS